MLIYCNMSLSCFMECNHWGNWAKYVTELFHIIVVVVTIVIIIVVIVIIIITIITSVLLSIAYEAMATRIKIRQKEVGC